MLTFHLWSMFVNMVVNPSGRVSLLVSCMSALVRVRVELGLG